MNADIFLELALKSAIFAGVGLLLLWLIRGRSAEEKAAVAAVALISVLLLPLSTYLLPDIHVPAPAFVTDVIASSTAPLIGSSMDSAPTAPAAIATDSLSMESVVLLLYSFPALLLFAGLLMGIWNMERVRSRADVLTDSRWVTALAHAQHRLSVKHGTALLKSCELKSPASWGILRPIIIIDAAALTKTHQAEAVIAHELAHVVRFDWLTLLVGRLAICLFWFNPLVWVLVRQAHQLCEEAADDSVLRAGVPTLDYANVLVEAVRHANGAALLPVNGVAPSRSSLARRVTHILDPLRPRCSPRVGWAAAVLASACSFNVAFAAAVPGAQTTLSGSFDSGAGERAAARLQRMSTAQARRIGVAIETADWSARRGAAATIFNEPAAVEPLVEALRDDRPVVRRLGAWGLSEMRPLVGATASVAVATLLGDPSEEVRGQAARTLGDFGAIAYSNRIAHLLGDPDPGVRQQAAHALGDLQNPRSRMALEAALHDPDPGVRSKVHWALQQIAEAEAVLERYSGG